MHNAFVKYKVPTLQIKIRNWKNIFEKMKNKPGYIFNNILAPIKPLKMHQPLITLIQKEDGFTLKCCARNTSNKY